MQCKEIATPRAVLEREIEIRRQEHIETCRKVDERDRRIESFERDLKLMKKQRGYYKSDRDHFREMARGMVRLVEKAVEAEGGQ